jgi:hypothetical protein
MAVVGSYRPLDDRFLLAGSRHPSSMVRWADSGAMALTGRRDGPPLAAPIALIERLDGLAARLEVLTTAMGRPVVVDGPALLGERASLASLRRNGTVSVGGGSRLLRASEDWIAVSLARVDDVALLPAWLGIDVPSAVGEPPWEAVTEAALPGRAAGLVARAAVLGLAVARLGETASSSPVLLAERGAGRARGVLDGTLVIDLSSLWAGPLCASLLAAAGARVVKVESTRRPDGSRLGRPAFFDLLNAGKDMVALDVTTALGRGALRHLIELADVVIEASRPRALEQLGCDVGSLRASNGPRVWTSITAHGRAGRDRNRAGFGDDVAVAGGLVAADADGPCFCADAVADPLTGLVAAVATLDRLAVGGRWHLDVAMARTARWAAGSAESLGVPSSATVSATTLVRPPRARPDTGVAGALGADTARVLGELGVN